jgi:hypothetical protein
MLPQGHSHSVADCRLLLLLLLLLLTCYDQHLSVRMMLPQWHFATKTLYAAALH